MNYTRIRRWTGLVVAPSKCRIKICSPLCDNSWCPGLCTHFVIRGRAVFFLPHYATSAGGCCILCTPLCCKSWCCILCTPLCDNSWCCILCTPLCDKSRGCILCTLLCDKNWCCILCTSLCDKSWGGGGGSLRVSSTCSTVSKSHLRQRSPR